MGHVRVRLRISDIGRRRTLDVEGVVDTGATLTVIPRRLAEELGLEVTGRSLIETGAGRLELDRGRVWVEIMGRSEIVPVLISDTIDKVLVGVATLEVLGLQVDPMTGRLREWTLLLYRAA